MKRRAVIEEAIGETRAAIYEGRKLVELHVRRHAKTVPNAGDIYCGRVTSIEPSLAGAFVELGNGPAGLLKFSAQKDLPRMTEGMYLDVVITKASMSGKGPLLAYAGEASADKPKLVTAQSLTDWIRSRFDGITFDEASVSVIDEACERQIAIKGGGAITLDQTQALLAIDVDKGAAESPILCSLAAAELIASQMRLRGLGGLVAIDFPNLRQPKHRNSLIKSLERAFADDLATVRIAPLSRFGVVEMTRSQIGPSLDQIMHDRFGNPTDETLALRGLRWLEREYRANSGAKHTLVLPKNAEIWLTKTEFDWKSALEARIGTRYEIKVGDSIDVTADR